ncbi:hypothetical protein VNO80_19569 [Phaseolus coccineus]|uniref:Secreted protein n=1 Tax=Phaseolus coccineus TaxID=3886 RepID=A0AAN9R0C9_PHACN
MVVKLFISRYILTVVLAAETVKKRRSHSPFPRVPVTVKKPRRRCRIECAFIPRNQPLNVTGAPAKWPELE